jgi:hypothetical protein
MRRGETVTGFFPYYFRPGRGGPGRVSVFKHSVAIASKPALMPGRCGPPIPGHPDMHIPRWFLWLLLYAAAIFAWIVFFEHGPGEENLTRGAQSEWQRIWKAVNGWLGRPGAP